MNCDRPFYEERKREKDREERRGKMRKEIAALSEDRRGSRDHVEGKREEIDITSLRIRLSCRASMFGLSHRDQVAEDEMKPVAKKEVERREGEERKEKEIRQRESGDRRNRWHCEA
ncbi:hypothetical protein TIFTF001_021892 [Ficus carica]|uniref:Uncharacterized protein n=1 Tax=Ficus carica TaxID=3494 RepID=A0AA88DCB1_FICCA|nr:hypothetical protein TIFTF001_021892 [Ficus carica]